MSFAQMLMENMSRVTEQSYRLNTSLAFNASSRFSQSFSERKKNNMKRKKGNFEVWIFNLIVINKTFNDVNIIKLYGAI